MIIVTKSLSSVDLGLYYASAAYPQLLSRIFDLGLPHATRFYLLRFPNQVRYLSIIIAVLSAAVFPFIACIFLFLDRLPLEIEEISYEISRNWIVLSIYCLVLILNSIFNGLIISLEKYRTLLVASTIPYAIFIAMVGYAAYAGTLSVSNILVQLMISELIILVICLTPIVRMVLKSTEKAPHEFGWREVVMYGLKIYPNGFLKTMTTRLDRVVLSFIASPVFIGHYSVLVTLRDIATIPVTTYGQTFMNEMAKSIKRVKNGIEERGGIKKMMNKSLLWILGIYTVGFVGFLVLQNFILNLFFHDLSDPKIYLMATMLVISAIPNVLLAFIHYWFLAVNKPQHISISSALALVSFYGFVGLTYQSMGSDSFIYASVISALVGFSYLYFYYRALLRTLPI